MRKGKRLKLMASKYNDDDGETTTVRVFIINETAKAILVSTLPVGDPNARKIWIPKSQMTHISKDIHHEGEFRPANITLRSWLAEQHEL